MKFAGSFESEKRDKPLLFSGNKHWKNRIVDLIVQECSATSREFVFNSDELEEDKDYIGRTFRLSESMMHELIRSVNNTDRDVQFHNPQTGDTIQVELTENLSVHRAAYITYRLRVLSVKPAVKT